MSRHTSLSCRLNRRRRAMRAGLAAALLLLAQILATMHGAAYGFELHDHGGQLCSFSVHSQRDTPPPAADIFIAPEFVAERPALKPRAIAHNIIDHSIVSARAPPPLGPSILS